MQKLIKSMLSTKAKRETTVVRFSPSAPTIAVGDNRGSVGIYIIRNPVAKLYSDEMQQIQQLRAALHGETAENRFDPSMSPIASPTAIRSPQKSPNKQPPEAEIANDLSAHPASEAREAEPTAW